MINDLFPLNILTMLLLKSQVDQLVLEEVVRERFPKLGIHSN
jgi:hypothetical protein